MDRSDDPKSLPKLQQELDTTLDKSVIPGAGSTSIDSPHMAPS